MNSKSSSNLNGFLLALVAFLSGAAVMIIELTGNRVLAPVFGNSLYTWTGLIGVILIAMGGGYSFGGWIADRRSSPVILASILSAAAVFTFLIPLLHLVLGQYLFKTSIVWGPAVASLVFFAVPGFLLGSATPFCVRLASLLSSDKHIGASSGYIGMSSMLGSVAGTFGTGFILIPRFDIWTIFLVTGLVLSFLSAVIYWIALPWPKNRVAALVCLAVALIFVKLIFMFTPPMPWYVLMNKTTPFHRILVFRSDTLPNGDFLKTINLDTETSGMQYEISREIFVPYQRYWKLAKIFCPKMDRALFLGGGSFSMPEALSREYPLAKVEVVEIDPQVIEAGRKFFRAGEFDNMTVVPVDARRHLASGPGQYDLIFGDVFYGRFNVPFHLVTQEFFALVRERLTGNGVYMMNIISALKGDKAGFFSSIIKTIGSVFPQVDVYALDPGHLEDFQNIIIVASSRPLYGVLHCIDEKGVDQDVQQMLSSYVPANQYSVGVAPVFTDKYNPVEYVAAQAADRLSRKF